MAATEYSAEQVVRRGEEIYDGQIRLLVEPGHKGEFLVLDIDSGEYEVDADEVAALRRMMDKNPTGVRYLKRIGFAATHRLGGRLIVQREAQ